MKCDLDLIRKPKTNKSNPGTPGPDLHEYYAQLKLQYSLSLAMNKSAPRTIQQRNLNKEVVQQRAGRPSPFASIRKRYKDRFGGPVSNSLTDLLTVLIRKLQTKRARNFNAIGVIKCVREFKTNHLEWKRS